MDKKEYNHTYYLKNKATAIAQAREWEKNNPEKARISNIAHHRRKRFRLKMAVIEAYGGKCAVCGITDVRVLQIDHIVGGGSKELKKENNRYLYYRNVVAAKSEGKYQLLCANCNWIKRFENHESGGGT